MLFGCYLVVLVEVGWFLLDCYSVGISVMIRYCIMLSLLDIGFV